MDGARSIKDRPDRGKLLTTPLAWLFQVALLTSCYAAFTALSPGMPEPGLDPSWMLAMNQAIAQKLVMGRDIVFTFGPYASIYTKSFHPATDHLMILGGLYLGLCFFLAAYLNFRQSTMPLQLGLVIVMTCAVFSLDALLLVYPLMVGTFVCVRAEQCQVRISTLALALLVSPFGLLPLIKLSAAGACLAATALMAMLLLIRQRWWHLLTVTLVPAMSMIFFWTFAGQATSDLPQYLRSAVPIISGYTDAMSLKGNSMQVAVFILCAMGLTAAVWTSTKQDGLPARTFTGLLFAATLFVAFKSGFIRHDWHALIAASAILLAALLAGVISPTAWRMRVVYFGILAFVAIAPAHRPPNAKAWFDALISPYTAAWTGIRQRITEPGKLHSDFQTQISILGSTAGFPRMEGTVDIYSYEQSLLIASGNHWNPRPIFQSYSAYTPELAEINRQHLLGSDRPDNLIFNVQPIDSRLPALEDGSSWSTILSDYEPVAMSNEELVLRQRPEVDRRPGPDFVLPPATGQMGQAMDLPSNDGLLFARLRLEQSLAGRLWNFFYKPDELRITLELRDGEVRRYRLIAGMAESEFLLSPLIESSAEFGQLSAGAKLNHKQVVRMTIQQAGWGQSWKQDYQLDIESMPSLH